MLVKLEREKKKQKKKRQKIEYLSKSDEMQSWKNGDLRDLRESKMMRNQKIVFLNELLLYHMIAFLFIHQKLVVFFN